MKNIGPRKPRIFIIGKNYPFARRRMNKSTGNNFALPDLCRMCRYVSIPSWHSFLKAEMMNIEVKLACVGFSSYRRAKIFKIHDSVFHQTLQKITNTFLPDTIEIGFAQSGLCLASACNQD